MTRNKGRALGLRAVHALLVITAIVLSGSTPVFSQQRAIANPSIEQPVINSDNIQINADLVPGWQTTHPVRGVNGRLIEIWRNGSLGVNTAAGAGNQFVELNADAISMIYQQVCMTNGESFNYSFLHRGRQSSFTRDRAQFRIGIPTGLPTGSIPADSYSYPILNVATTNNGNYTTPTGSGTYDTTPSSAGNGWRRYSGTYTYTGPTQMVNIGFRSISGAGGDTLGNFIDDWQIQLAPYLEFSASSDSGPEGTGVLNTPDNRPGIRIGGNVTSPVTVTVQHSGGTATLGEDFSMTVPYIYGDTTNTVVITIPPGVYDGSSAASIFRIPFSIGTDMSLEPDETAEFQVISVTGAAVASIATCAVPPVTTMSYTILNDDLTTAGGIDISGRVVTRTGYGLRLAAVTLFLADGTSRRVLTNHFGYYRFSDIPAGQFVILDAGSKTATFSSGSQGFITNDHLTNVDFIAD